ncbi:MAG: hypothetical protein ACOC0A_04260 [Planctomycetota bacterium]
MLQFLINAITKYPHLKAVAFVLAVGIWVYANSRVQQEATLDIPIKVRVPDGYELVYQSHMSANVHLRGPQYVVNQRQEEASLGNLFLQIPIAPTDVSDKTVELEPEPSWLNIADSELVRMEVRSILPTRLQLRFSPIIDKTLPVGIQTSGVPRRGHDVKATSSVPPEVEVRGPAIALNQMEKVPTEKVPLWDVKSSFRRMTRLQTQVTVSVGNNVQIPVTYEVQPSTVAVHVETGQEDQEKTLSDLPVRLMLPPKFPFEVDIVEGESQVEIVVEGPPDAVNALSVDSFLVFVDASDLVDETIDPGDKALYKEDVQIHLLANENVEILSITPEKVTMELINPE